MAGLTSRLGRELYVALLLALTVLMASYVVTPVGGATYSFRAVSCHAFDFFPLTSANAYRQNAAERYPVAQDFMTCAPDLPHKAIVTKVQFTINDASDTGKIQNCALCATPSSRRVQTCFRRWPPYLRPFFIETLGIQRLSTSAFSSATIDNTRFAYFLQCQFLVGAASSQTSILGATVNFNITAGNG
jgi:hypothetical protein